MYYVPDGTRKCGFYQCDDCGERFLSLRTEKSIICPMCEREIDPEIGPDEVMPENTPNARLMEVLEGDAVEQYDTLLSLAVTGGDDSWI